MRNRLDELIANGPSKGLGSIIRCRYEVALAVIIAVHAPTAGAQQMCGDWTQVSPPAGATGAVTDVQARSATEAFAFAIPLALIRWDGAAWSDFPLPDPFGDYSQLWIDQFGLVGPSHLFLAGRGDTGPFSNDQVLRSWDGADWSDWASVTLQPNIQGAPRNGAANAVVGTAPDDVWILGVADSMGGGVAGSPLLTVHWDGSQLTEYITPGPGDRQNNLRAAVAIASDDIWVVGDYNNSFTGDTHFRGLTYHWDGTSWSHVPNPSEDITRVHLYAVAAIASDDVWAAGRGQAADPFFMHWDGSEWSVVPSPQTTGTIYKIAAIASDDVWAVDFAAQVPVIGKFYHWDGDAWSIHQPQQIPGAVAVNRHGGLAAAEGCDIWAVGSIDFGQGMEPFIERLVANPVDSDGDGVQDQSDNCLAVENNDQRDTNNDGFGNACDADLDNDCSVNFADLSVMASAFFSTPGAPNWNPDADLVRAGVPPDNIVNFLDLYALADAFFGAPGPSGVPNICDGR